MDARSLYGQPTGVGSYAQTLRQAQQTLVAEALLLGDRPSLTSELPQSGRTMRRLRAVWPFPRRASAVTSAGTGTGMLIAPDIFRVAQIFFDFHRRLLPVRFPGPPGIMHWSYPVPLRVVEWTNIYSVHDAIPLLAPDLSPIDPVRHRRLLTRIGQTAAAIVTVSGAARIQLVTAMGWAADRIVDCGQAVDTSPAAALPLPEGLQPGGYLLVVGTVEPRKNIPAICTAYAESGVSMPLVVAGPNGWGADRLSGDLARPGIIRLPYLPRDQVRALMAQARALLMPSLMEGFGLPVAEAMALGVPVLTANEGALAETAHDAALLADPRDVQDIARGMRRIVHDEALRTALIVAGHRNVQRFTVPRLAASLAALYGRLEAT